jgi:hypothetical protein
MAALVSKSSVPPPLLPLLLPRPPLPPPLPPLPLPLPPLPLSCKALVATALAAHDLVVGDIGVMVARWYQKVRFHHHFCPCCFRLYHRHSCLCHSPTSTLSMAVKSTSGTSIGSTRPCGWRHRRHGGAYQKFHFHLFCLCQRNSRLYHRHFRLCNHHFQLLNHCHLLYRFLSLSHHGLLCLSASLTLAMCAYLGCC